MLETGEKEYQQPQVVTYSEADILEIIGPAQTCTTGYSPT